MSIAKSYTAHLIGLTAELVTVEVDISNGLHALSIVGLGDRAVEEAKDRVSAAIKNSGYTSPKQKNQKVVVSLAPADVRKEGPAFDLAIAMTYLCASGELSCDLSRTLFLGELSLEGHIQKVSGVLPIACQIRSVGFDRIFIPQANTEEASLATDVSIYAVSSLAELIQFLTTGHGLEPIRPSIIHSDSGIEDNALDMSMIRGNDSAKRCLEIAAAGMHNILMYGPPGTGKTMLAQSFPTILPALTREESIEVTSIHSAARLSSGLIRKPPFRAPHHTASHTAIIGGGSIPRPGEITLAHRGVLFFDEFPEFDRNVIEALRQPLEDHSITVSRAKGSVQFPAHCIFMASMNPCPCGKRQAGGCTCHQNEIRTYERKVSGPILDRIDIWINVQKVDYARLSARNHRAESSAAIRARVVEARRRQAARFVRKGITKRFNSEMDADDISRIAVMSREAREMLQSSARERGISGRAFHRIIKVAQTIVDLAGEQFIKRAHIMEALQYRQNVDWDTAATDRGMRQRTDSEHRGPRSAREAGRETGHADIPDNLTLGDALTA
jgi:magnesium chelatase family protein